MSEFLRDFIKVLRASDVRISTAEAIDAMRASTIIGLEDKAMLKVSLSQSLAKSLREKEIFDECYNNFFKEDYMNLSSKKDYENVDTSLENESFDERNNDL